MQFRCRTTNHESVAACALNKLLVCKRYTRVDSSSLERYQAHVLVPQVRECIGCMKGRGRGQQIAGEACEIFQDKKKTEREARVWMRRALALRRGSKCSGGERG